MRFLIFVGALVIPVILGFAVWDASKRGSMAMGEACEDDKYCESGHCVAAGDTRLCAEMCSGQCSDGFTCVPMEAPEDLGTVYYYCLPSELAASHATPEPEPEPEPESPAAVDAVGEDEREGPVQGQGAVQKATKKKRRAKTKKRRKRRRRKLSKAALLRRR